MAIRPKLMQQTGASNQSRLEDCLIAFADYATPGQLCQEVVLLAIYILPTIMAAMLLCRSGNGEYYAIGRTDCQEVFDQFFIIL